MYKKRTGLVLGKFMPLHKGHELLLRFAENFVDTLYVVVDNVPNAAIEGKIRHSWVKNTVTNAEVFYIPRPTPQAPSETPDFWDIWKNCLLSLIPHAPDYLFASEEYGFKLAAILGAQFIPFDLQRNTITISATQIRQNPMQHWDYLSEAAKSYYLKRFCIFGPESTGKTTLATQLASHFDTVAVPEYARLYIEAKKDITIADMEHIAKGQVALENTLSAKARKVLFSDTDALATTIWSRWLFNSCSADILEIAQNHLHDFYLLTEPDLKWESDFVRYFPNDGTKFFDDCVKTLERFKCNYAIIGGENKNRLENALSATYDMLPDLLNGTNPR